METKAMLPDTLADIALYIKTAALAVILANPAEALRLLLLIVILRVGVTQ